MMLILLVACAPPATLTEVQADIFDNSCAFSTCHGSGSGAQGLSLAPGASWAEMVDVPAEQAPDIMLVAPGDHANSYVWQKCANQGDIIGGVMPDGGDGLDAEHLAQLESWIDNGALDD